MKYEDVKNLIKLIRENDIAEVEIEEPDLRIRIRRDSVADQVQGNASPPQPLKVKNEQLSVSSAHEHESAEPDETADKSFEEDRYKKVYAPLVGTFYRSPSPDSEPFVREGDIIRKGSVICIIEAMKVMNEIESEHAGKVVAIPVDNATPVEYGEPICIVDPFV